jgi:hypothetical protein
MLFIFFANLNGLAIVFTLIKEGNCAENGIVGRTAGTGGTAHFATASLGFFSFVKSILSAIFYIGTGLAFADIAAIGKKVGCTENYH